MEVYKMASGGVYSYRFPEVNMDPQSNYPSAAGIIKKITAEEWADIIHHTHKITEITDVNGNKLGSGAGGTITAYDDTEIRNLINNLQSKLTALTNENNEQKTTISNLQSQITTLSNSNNTLQSQVAEITNENSTLKEDIIVLQSKVTDLENNGGGGNATDGFIIDYDIDKDGIQDINGNDINN
jgi:hypothetical protein